MSGNLRSMSGKIISENKKYISYENYKNSNFSTYFSSKLTPNLEKKCQSLLNIGGNGNILVISMYF